MFAEYLDEQLLLALPHRQFVFTPWSGHCTDLPKALRVFLRRDQRLFADLARLIFSLIAEFYSMAAGKPILSAAVVASQPFGDSLRFNPHLHALIPEGGFDSTGQFYHLPIHDTARLAECLRWRTIGLFLKLGLIRQQFTDTLLCRAMFRLNFDTRCEKIVRAANCKACRQAPTWKRARQMMHTSEKKIPVLDLKGDPYMRGRQHGEALRSGVHDMLLRESETNVPLLGAQRSRLQEHTNKFIPYIQKYAPDLLDEMRGIADGAGVSLNDIVQLNCNLELSDDLLPANFAKHYPACTSYAVNGSVTADGCVYLGQTYDMPAYYQPNLVLFRVPTTGGGSALIQSFAGVVGCTGVNSHGIALVINNLFPDDTQPGVPHWIVVRKVLDQQRIGDAIGTIMGSTRASGFNYTLGNANEVVGVETSATEADFLYADDGYLHHANHYLTERLKPRDLLHTHAFADPKWSATYSRSLRMGRLLKDAIGRGKVTPKQLWEMMSNHEDFPYSICFHAHEATKELDITEGATVGAVILNPKTGEMQITNGNPCRSIPEKHALCQGA